MDLHLIAKVLIILFILISICTMNIFLLILTIVFAILYVCLSQQPTKYKYLKKKKKRIKTTQSSPSTQSTQSISYDTLTTPTDADTTNTATNTEPSFQSSSSNTDRISYNTSLNSTTSDDVILSSKNAQFFQERAFSQVSNTASKNRMLVPEPVENRNNLEVQARSLQPPYLISQDSTGGRLPDYMRNVKIRST